MPAVTEKKSTVKAHAMKLVREMSENSSWDELMYQIYVRQKIESGLTDLSAGKTHDHTSICREFEAGA